MAKEKTGNIMTIEELAVYLKLSKSTLYKLSQEGKVPGQKVGRHWRYHKDRAIACRPYTPRHSLETQHGSATRNRNTSAASPLK